MTQKGRSTPSFPFNTSIFLVLLFLIPLPRSSQATNGTSTSSPNGTESGSATNNPNLTASVLPNFTSTSNATAPAPGCGVGLDPIYSNLCDRQAAWGIVVETLATLGFLVTAGLLLGLAGWALWVCVPFRRRRGIAGTVASLLLSLLATAGLFGLTFAFIVRLTPQTCPTRVFLFGVLFALAFSSLLARSLALQGFGVVRGPGEAGLVLALTAVQVIVATEWLVTVLVRDGLPCSYTQGEFVALLVYVLCLLAAALAFTTRGLCRSCCAYSYSYTGASRTQTRVQAALLCLAAVLSAAIWVVWIALLTRGNSDMGRRPAWDDPVLSVALVANGWVLLLAHGLAQTSFLCRGEARGKEGPLDFTGWTSPSTDMPGLGSSTKTGRENCSFESDGQDRRGKRQEPVLRSPYESGFSMTEIDPDRDYSIPRPQTTNTTEPYDDYYGNRLAD
ncbi:hypothetical protein MATL_G00210170 [Megalops atlanticus]|uniref:G-protein coupled receptors family 3 profile domain-containing protein n=1 Tax=Megalops atlanticus TaxID=7932 RepID=A0A9D3PHJ5_MEGAT|nr:hypothetical protein MATL_G00210170 [Megalops atlanticus]